jgi:bifunctional ADP-heptose synthase (sugar kinase/adenylyltransferase)
VVDTVAAGHAIVGALAVSIKEGHSVETALRWACAAGALASTKAGAQPWVRATGLPGGGFVQVRANRQQRDSKDPGRKLIESARLDPGGERDRWPENS